MAVSYTPNLFKGDHYAEIFAGILEKNKTVSKGLIRIIDNVKNEVIVSSRTGAATIQSYKADISSTDSLDTLLFKDEAIVPAKKMFYIEFNPDTLRSTRFSADMLAGAANVESNQFLLQAVTHYGPEIARAMDVETWVQLAAKTAAGSGAIAMDAPAGGVVNQTNIAAVMADAYEKIPNALLNSGLARIFANEDYFKFVMLANLSATYRDIFTVSGENHYYLGVKIEYVPVPGVIAGRWDDYVMATDLTSDFGSFEVGKVKANSDIWFLKAVFALGTAVLVPSQKVYLGV